MASIHSYLVYFRIGEIVTRFEHTTMES